MMNKSQSLLYFLILISNFTSPIVLSGAEFDHECFKEQRCGPSRREPAVRFPFRLRGHHPPNCTDPDPDFDLHCDENRHTVLNLPGPAKLFVKTINYVSQKLEIYDPDRCLTKLLISNPNLNFSETRFRFEPYGSNLDRHVFFNCSLTGDGQTYDEVDDFDRYVPCLSNTPGYGVRAVSGSSVVLSLVGCRKIEFRTLVPDYVESSSYESSVYLSWSEPDCNKCEQRGMGCGLLKQSVGVNVTGTGTGTECFDLPKESSSGTKRKIVITGAILVSFLLIIATFGIYHIHRKNEEKRKNEVKIKKFLEDYKELKVTRYSYIDTWNMTRGFALKIGQGAFGTVYKGTLSDNILVAVKMLDNLSENRQEYFINEVGSMGRAHHVNVARLVGFCADGKKRALVYEFFPNGSLERYISPENALGWEKINSVSLGIARGMEYLHHGCEVQILHFDIKPHNIMLDKNFVPKISDFGLAKLCAKEESNVTVTWARGTVGYIAPEVASRNFGKPSYKSDVYSFGMLLLEMVGGRENIDVNVENASRGIKIEAKIEGKSKITRKLTIVALMCIQWQPMDRPSMKYVVQMLEGEGDNLIVPPNPFASTNLGTNNIIGDNRPRKAQNFELEIISEA